MCVKPRPYQEQCRSNIVECYKLNDSFDNVECCFHTFAVFGNNVAGFGNNAERKFVLSTNSKQIEHVQFVSTLSKGRHFTIESSDIVAVCGNKVECSFDKVERCFDNVACCFDIVAGVDGALQTTTDNDDRRQRAKQYWPIRRVGNNLGRCAVTQWYYSWLKCVV